MGQRQKKVEERNSEAKSIVELLTGGALKLRNLGVSHR
jgi:hypothetical protein